MTFLNVKPLKADYNGKEYFLALAKVESTQLGYEDHGLFSVTISFDGGSWGQSYGGISLGDGSSTGDFVKAMLEVFQVSNWESIQGREVYVMRTEYSGLIRGIASRDETKVFISDDFWKDR